jgi:hypothetical protein
MLLLISLGVSASLGAPGWPLRALVARCDSMIADSETSLVSDHAARVSASPNRVTLALLHRFGRVQMDWPMISGTHPVG